MTLSHKRKCKTKAVFYNDRTEDLRDKNKSKPSKEAVASLVIGHDHWLYTLKEYLQFWKLESEKNIITQ